MIPEFGLPLLVSDHLNGPRPSILLDAHPELANTFALSEDFWLRTLPEATCPGDVP